MSGIALLRIATLPFEALAPLRAGRCLPHLASMAAEESALAEESERICDELFRAAGPASADPGRARARFALLRIRRDVHNQRRIRDADLEAARPLLAPALAARLEAHVQARDRRERVELAYESAFALDIANGRAELLRIFAAPLVDHGVYLASRSLVPAARRLTLGDRARPGHDERHTLAKVAAYIARFATKTSPNGLFCAVGLAPIEGDAAVVEGSCDIATVDVLLSLAEVRKVSAVLAVDPEAESAVRARPNPTLRLKDGMWTWWRPASPRNEDDREVHARAKDQPVLRAFVEQAAAHESDPAALVAAVAAKVERAADELRPFYATLVERGILIGEIEVPYSARTRLRELAKIARERGARAPWIARIARIEDDVAALPALAEAERTEAMERIVQSVAALPRNRPFKADELFRVDSRTSLQARLPERIGRDLRAPLSLFARLLAAIYPDELNRRVLHRRFLRLHSPDTDVEFLDLYGSLVQEGGENDGGPRPLEFDAPAAAAEGLDPEDARAGVAQRRLWRLVIDRARAAAPGEEVELDEESLSPVVGDIREPRWAAGALFQIAAAGGADVEAGRYRLVLNALFNGIGLALARFAHLLGGADAGSGNPVVVELRRAWKAMERPGALIAELTFNHEARTANAGLRPALFAHEIELPGDLATPGVERIPLHDLVLRYESAQRRLVLRSRRLGCEVIPVVSSGVSPSGIVSELLHIGRQGWQTVGYLPGFHTDEIVRWPRFTCGKVVLFRARWVLRADEIPGRDAPSDARFFLEVARWRAKHGLPRHVFVHTQAEPKPFYVDLEAPVLVDLLRRAIATSAAAKSAPILFVTEMLPGPGEMWIRDARGSRAAEFLVQMGGPHAADQQAAPPRRSS